MSAIVSWDAKQTPPPSRRNDQLRQIAVLFTVADVNARETRERNGTCLSLVPPYRQYLRLLPTRMSSAIICQNTVPHTSKRCEVGLPPAGRTFRV
ncbi:hypothetical protein KC335_g158 [Hortaea werneckii]|nr:hypothetical protein KC335_g158 [Hortaea werneckii]